MNPVRYFTQSELTTYLRCQRRHRFGYAEGWKPKETPTYLAYGTAFHEGLRALYGGRGLEAAFRAGDDFSVNSSEDSERLRATYLGQIEAYAAYYDDELSGHGDLDMTGGWTELPFSVTPITPPLLRPFGRIGFAGRIDHVAKGRDGTWWLVEHKTASTVEPAYFNRLSVDFQISFYLMACDLIHRESPSLFPQITGVIYNVLRKPSIRPRQKESLEDYRVRLRADMLERPDFYFAREWATRSGEDMGAFMDDVMTLCFQIRRDEGRKGRETHNPAECGFCAFLSVCSSPREYWQDILEERFVRKSARHEELENPEDAAIGE